MCEIIVFSASTFGAVDVIPIYDIIPTFTLYT